LTNYLRIVYHLDSLLRHVHWPRRKLVKHQEKMLRQIVTYAYHNVPFYRKEFKEVGISPSDIRTVADLNFLKVIRRCEVRDNLDDMIGNNVKRESLIRLATSGSTGHPLVLYVSKAEDEFRKARHLRSYISCGLSARDRWVVISLPDRFQATGKFQRRLGIFSPKFISVFDDPAQQISLLRRLRPEVLDGYSSSLLLIAKGIEREAIGGIKPKMIFRGAELLDDYSSRFIERTFGCPSYDQYATIEFERIAWQCPLKRGYHIDADALIIQFVDKNGEEVSEEESGEIVCTDLFNYSMPLLRYAVGDIGKWTSDECPCGRTLPMMKVIEGRKDSLIVLSDGRVLSPIPFIAAMDAFAYFQHIDQFRIVQKKTDYVEIQLVKKDDAVKEEILETQLLKHLYASLGIDYSAMVFEARFVNKIPLDKSGKLMAVTSEVNKSS
jgi:phenylacetate-CoA ligase